MGVRALRAHAARTPLRRRKREAQVKIMGLREHTLFWAACVLAVASFAYGTYVLMAWSPATASPSDLPSGLVALSFYVLSTVRAYGVPRP